NVSDNPMRYVLVESPRPSAGETVPEDDRRFDQRGTPHVLREDREAHVAYHLESTPVVVEARAVFHAETAGEFVVPPARVEMMYRTEVHGHSGTFAFRVTEPDRKR